MKVHSVGGWILGALFMLFILWQLGDAVFNGRMVHILDEDEDVLYFFESPFLFIIQFVVLAAVGAATVYAGLRKFRKKFRKGA